MKRLKRRLLSTALVLAMALTLFAAIPLTAGAASAESLKAAIEGFDHGGSGEPLTATVSGNTVTVTGTVTGVTRHLRLYIDSGVTVVWKADYSGSISGHDLQSMLSLLDSGTFEVAAGGSIINNGTDHTILSSGTTAIKVSGGTVSAAETAEALNAIYATNPAAEIIVSGGMVSGWRPIRGGSVTVSGGTVLSTGYENGTAIFSPKVSVTGGTVSATGENGEAIISTEVYVTGGTVSATGAGECCAISCGGANLSGGFVFAYTATIFGPGHNGVIGMDGTPTISGGAVLCAWNKAAGNTTYANGSSDDLAVAPIGATAAWGKEGSLSGIHYANGSNTGFFPIDGVTVTSAAFTVTFDSLGGSAVASLTVDSGASALRPENPEKEGFNFGGWFTNESFSALYDFDAPVTSDITLYAYWYEGDPEPTPTPTPTAPPTPTPTPPPFPFTDVPDTAWFRDDVEAAWRMGLIDGKTPTLYMPKDNLTYAEAVKLAACMHQLFTDGAVTLANATGGNPWYMTYVDYAKDNGIIDHDYEWGAPATRAGYIEIFANALPDEELPPMNAVSNGAIPDVPMTHPQAAAIYKLYRAGILTGVDAAHNCNPNANIMRSEVATILVRMMDPAERKSFSM